MSSYPNSPVDKAYSGWIGYFYNDASDEGWDLVYSEDKTALKLVRDGYDKIVFTSDADAYLYVLGRATNGSRLHRISIDLVNGKYDEMLSERHV